MSNKFLKVKKYTILLLLSFTNIVDSKPSYSYGELDKDERKELFTNKSHLPENDPNKLITLLTYGINDQDNDVLLAAVGMSIFTISGVESRAQSGDPVAIDKATYEAFLKSFVKLRNHPDLVVQSMLKETKILDEKVLRKLLNEPNQQPPADVNKSTTNKAAHSSSNTTFDQPIKSEAQRFPNKKPTTIASKKLSKSKKRFSLPWITAGALLIGFLLLKTLRGKSTS